MSNEELRQKMRRNYQRLMQLGALPLEAKVERSLRLIRKFYEAMDGRIYVSFSGGKDSTVLLKLVRYLYPKVPAMFVDTGLEFPEVREFAMSQENVIVVKPKKTFKRVLEEYGYPVVSKDVASRIENVRKYPKRTLAGIAPRWQPLIHAPFKISPHCCKIMKTNPAKSFAYKNNLHPMIGTTAFDSNMRRVMWLKSDGCVIVDDDRPRAMPLSVWKEQDILQFIQDYDVPIASVYGELVEGPSGLEFTGYERTGCVFCMFGLHLDRVNRFKRLKTTHPHLHHYCMEQLNLKEVISFMGLPYE